MGVTSKEISLDFILIFKFRVLKGNQWLSSLLKQNYAFRLAEYFMLWLELGSEEIVTLAQWFYFLISFSKLYIFPGASELWIMEESKLILYSSTLQFGSKNIFS